MKNRNRGKRPKIEYKKAYRICNNPHCNDWNDEPERIAVPYYIMAEKEKAYLVVRAGWGFGKKQQHHLPKREFYETKEECEAAIVASGKAGCQ